jgi:hypothetical protein
MLEHNIITLESYDVQYLGTRKPGCSYIGYINLLKPVYLNLVSYSVR